MGEQYGAPAATFGHLNHISGPLTAALLSCCAQDFVKPGSNVKDPFGNSIKYVELGYPGECPCLEAMMLRVRKCQGSDCH